MHWADATVHSPCKRPQQEVEEEEKHDDDDMYHHEAALFCVKWHHGRHLEV